MSKLHIIDMGSRTYYCESENIPSIEFEQLFEKTPSQVFRFIAQEGPNDTVEILAYTDLYPQKGSTPVKFAHGYLSNLNWMLVPTFSKKYSDARCSDGKRIFEMKREDLRKDLLKMKMHKTFSKFPA